MPKRRRRRTKAELAALYEASRNDPRRLFVENIIDLERFGNATFQQLKSVLEEAYNEVSNWMLSGQNPAGRSLSRWQRQHYLAAEARFREILRPVYGTLRDSTQSDMEHFGNLQAKHAEQVIRSQIMAGLAPGQGRFPTSEGRLRRMMINASTSEVGIPKGISMTEDELRRRQGGTGNLKAVDGTPLNPDDEVIVFISPRGSSMAQAIGLTGVQGENTDGVRVHFRPPPADESRSTPAIDGLDDSERIARSRDVAMIVRVGDLRERHLGISGEGDAHIFRDVSPDDIALVGKHFPPGHPLHGDTDPNGNLLVQALDKPHGAKLYPASFTNLRSKLQLQSIGSGTPIIGTEIETTRIGGSRLRAIVKTPIEGLTMGAWWQETFRRDQLNFKRSMQQSAVLGETVGQLSNRFRKTATGPVVAKLLARTMTNAVAARASLETYKANQDIAPTYQYIATLDSRTSIRCASLDGKEFGYDPQGPIPPQHINCRSTIIPVIDWTALGIPEPPEALTRLSRATAEGPTSFQNYEGWLKGQDATVQKEMMGKARAGLFRDGKLSLSEMVRKDATRYTLGDLRRRMRRRGGLVPTEANSELLVPMFKTASTEEKTEFMNKLHHVISPGSGEVNLVADAIGYKGHISVAAGAGTFAGGSSPNRVASFGSITDEQLEQYAAGEAIVQGQQAAIWARAVPDGEPFDYHGYYMKHTDGSPLSNDEWAEVVAAINTEDGSHPLRQEGFAPEILDGSTNHPTEGVFFANAWNEIYDGPVPRETYEKALELAVSQLPFDVNISTAIPHRGRYIDGPRELGKIFQDRPEALRELVDGILTNRTLPLYQEFGRNHFDFDVDERAENYIAEIRRGALEGVQYRRLRPVQVFARLTPQQLERIERAKERDVADGGTHEQALLAQFETEIRTAHAADFIRALPGVEFLEMEGEDGAGFEAGVTQMKIAETTAEGFSDLHTRGQDIFPEIVAIRDLGLLGPIGFYTDQEPGYVDRPMIAVGAQITDIGDSKQLQAFNRGWFSSNHPDQTIHHEMGHFMQLWVERESEGIAQMADQARKASRFAPQPDPQIFEDFLDRMAEERDIRNPLGEAYTMRQLERITARVSGYAQHNPFEYVAEYWSKVTAGYETTRLEDDAYDLMGGHRPIPDGSRGAGDRNTPEITPGQQADREAGNRKFFGYVPSDQNIFDPSGENLADSLFDDDGNFLGTGDVPESLR